MMIGFLSFIMGLLLLVSCTERSSVKEVSVTKTTYGYSDPDPIANPTAAQYPYFRFDGYTDTPEQKEWKIVELENKHIKLSVYPEIGGKIWGATEKSTGNEFIYDNDVVKFRDVAMRGAWTSGGIEVNFGIIGHAPTTCVPVDYMTKENKDGSVSCHIASLDLLTHTWWNVEINLPKDKAYFTTSTYWYNPTSTPQPYYQWMNAGYSASDDLQFFFPGSNYIGHPGDVHPWSIDEQGREIDWYKNNNFGTCKSYHITGENANFYAAYWHDKDFGSVHHSDFDDKLGMKVWIWGLSREGMIWEDLLTDTDGQYVELQSGRLLNQEGLESVYTPYKHFCSSASSTDHFTEYWYPVIGTGGVSATNNYGTLNIKKENGKLDIKFSPLQKISKDIYVKTSSGKEIFRETLSLNTLQSWEKNINIDNIGEENIEVIIGDNLLSFNDNKEAKALKRPQYSPKEFDWDSLYGKWLRGKQWMNSKAYTKAEESFLSALELDPLYVPALNEMAFIEYRKGEYNKCIEYAAQSLSIDTYDPDANLIYGAAYFAKGDSNEAIGAYSIAALSASHRTAAHIGIAKASVLNNDYNRASRYASKVIDESGFNSEALVLKALAENRMGNKKEASEALIVIDEKTPLNHFMRFEKFLNKDISEKDFASMFRNELPHETIIEIGIWYESMGLYEDALKLYGMMPKHPLIAYREAFLTSKIGEDPTEALSYAQQTSPDMVFPSRAEYIEPFRWAMLQKGSSWKENYYLGLVYINLGMKEAGLHNLNDCGISPDYAPFYITRAMISDDSNRIKDLLHAEKLEKSWRTGVKLMNEYKAAEDKEKMLTVGEEYIKLYPTDYRLGLKYAGALLAANKYEECISYLTNLKVLPNEGAIEGRVILRDCYIELAIGAAKKGEYQKAIDYVEASKEWIDNLGVGKPYDEDIDNRSEDYLQGYCYEKLNNKEKAEQLYKKVADYNHIHNSNTILSAIALRRGGKSDQAAKLMAAYQSFNNNQTAAKWADMIYRGNRAAADNIIKTGNTTSETSPFGTNFKDFGFITTVIKIVNLK